MIYSDRSLLVIARVLTIGRFVIKVHINLTQGLFIWVQEGVLTSIKPFFGYF